MTPSERCIAGGLESLAQLSKISGESQQTLINWHNNPKPNYQNRFNSVLRCAVWDHGGTND